MSHDKRDFARAVSSVPARAVAEALEALVDELKQRGVAPDEWEEACICHAVATLFQGKTDIAMNAVYLARIPKPDRVADATIFGSDVRLKRTELLAGMVRIRAMAHASDFDYMRDALARINDILHQQIGPHRGLTASAASRSIAEVLKDPVLIGVAGLEPLPDFPPEAFDGDGS